MASRILLTGFTPFGPHRRNPSETVTRRIAGSPPRGVALETLVLPVDYAEAFPAVLRALDASPFDAVLHLGLAANRRTPEFERFALNWRGGPMADESGRRIDGEPVDGDGPAAYLATLPVDRLVLAMRAAGVPCEASSHAGTFLCNQTLYQTLRHLDVHRHATRAGFLHLPEPADGRAAPSPDDDAAAPRPTIDDLERGVRAVLGEIAKVRRPRAVAAPGRRRRGAGPSATR